MAVAAGGGPQCVGAVGVCGAAAGEVCGGVRGGGWRDLLKSCEAGNLSLIQGDFSFAFPFFPFVFWKRGSNWTRGYSGVYCHGNWYGKEPGFGIWLLGVLSWPISLVAEQAVCRFGLCLGFGRDKWD